MATALQLPEAPVRGSDEHLARLLAAGDRRALGAIFERYRQELYRFCLGLLGESQDAQDALQNTMVKALRALPGEEREIALRPWLYRIAHNEAVELRRRQRDTQTLDGHLPDTQSSVPERAEQRERLEWVLRDLGDLPERQRAVLVMRELSGLDFAEIGAALGTSGAVVRQSLYEARRNLEQMDRGRSLRCEAVARELSDGDGRVSGRREIRAHLRGCADCRRFRDRIETRKAALAGVAPMPAAAGAGVLQSAMGGGGAGGAGLAAALGGGAVKTVGPPTVLKALATVAAVAVMGTAAVDRGSPAQRVPDEAAAVLSSPGARAGRLPAPEAVNGRTRRHRTVGGGAAPGAAAPARQSLAHRRRAPSGREPAGGIGAATARPEPTPAAANPETGAPVPAASAPQLPGSGTGNTPAEAAPAGDAKPESSAARAGAETEDGQTAPVEPPARPEHPVHPPQSQKPAAISAPAGSEEAVAAEEAPAPVAEPGSPEHLPGASNGKAKGREEEAASS